MQQVIGICVSDATDHWHLCIWYNRWLAFMHQIQQTIGICVSDTTDDWHLCIRYNRPLAFVYQMQQTIGICVSDATDHWHLCIRYSRPLAFVHQMQQTIGICASDTAYCWHLCIRYSQALTSDICESCSEPAQVLPLPLQLKQLQLPSDHHLTAYSPLWTRLYYEIDCSRSICIPDLFGTKYLCSRYCGCTTCCCSLYTRRKGLNTSAAGTVDVQLAVVLCTTDGKG